MRRFYVAVAAVVLAAVTLVATPGPGPQALGGATYANPVLDWDFPDPFVLPARGAFFAYATNSGYHVQVVTSPDLRRWTLHGEALPVLPLWAVAGQTWAPAVVEARGLYVLYFTARHRNAHVPCIGVATSAHPGGPFVSTSQHPLMCQPDRGGSIDPSPYRESDGSLWLLWKSEGNLHGEPTRIWSQRLASEGTWLVGNAHHLARHDRAWEGPIIENPAMVRMGPHLFLFYSGGRWEDTSYAIGYASCDSVAGPCRKAAEPLVRSSPAVAGPGGQEFFGSLDGTLWMVYHGWRPDRIGYPHGRRLMRLDKVTLVDGRPFVSGPTAHPVSVAGTPDHPAVRLVAQPSGTGYRVAARDGDVFAFGSATHEGSFAADTIGMARTRTGSGYWTATRDGKVNAFGDARGLPLLGAVRFRAPVTSMAATPSGLGYWLTSAIGEVHPAGDARHHGSLDRMRLIAPVVGLAPTPSGRGYWLATADGGVFAFGDARFAGSAVGFTPSPITGIAADPWGRGYWLSAADGGVFSFGGAPFHGSAVSHRPGRVVDIEADPGGAGYWLLGANGSVFTFGAATFHGATPMPG